jgi:centromere protein I
LTQVLYENIFRPLENAVLDNSVDSQVLILNFYTSLIRHWSTLLRLADEIDSDGATNISDLSAHVNKLALTVVQTSATVSTHSAVLGFLEQTALLAGDPVMQRHVRIVIPAGQLIYILFFGHSLSNVARLCAILAAYKRGFEIAMTTKPSRKPDATPINSSSYDRKYVNTFNGFLMDICNCLWRSRAFSGVDTNALGCLVPHSIIQPLTSYVSGLDTNISLSALFGLSHSPVLCLQSISCVRQIEKKAFDEGTGQVTALHAGPVTQATLSRLASSGGIQLTWQEYRISVLRALEAEGLVGIPDLMKNTMKILMNAKEGVAQ